MVGDVFLFIFEQVLPNFLNSEFENVIHYVMSLIQTDVLPIPYRLENTVHIPLIGMKGMSAYFVLERVR